MDTVMETKQVSEKPTTKKEIRQPPSSFNIKSFFTPKVATIIDKPVVQSSSSFIKDSIVSPATNIAVTDSCSPSPQSVGDDNYLEFVLSSSSNQNEKNESEFVVDLQYDDVEQDTLEVGKANQMLADSDALEIVDSSEVIVDNKLSTQQKEPESTTKHPLFARMAQAQANANKEKEKEKSKPIKVEVPKVEKDKSKGRKRKSDGPIDVNETETTIAEIDDKLISNESTSAPVLVHDASQDNLISETVPYRDNGTEEAIVDCGDVSKSIEEQVDEPTIESTSSEVNVLRSGRPCRRAVLNTIGRAEQMREELRRQEELLNQRRRRAPPVKAAKESHSDSDSDVVAVEVDEISDSSDDEGNSRLQRKTKPIKEPKVPKQKEEKAKKANPFFMSKEQKLLLKEEEKRQREEERLRRVAEEEKLRIQKQQETEERIREQFRQERSRKQVESQSLFGTSTQFNEQFVRQIMEKDSFDMDETDTEAIALGVSTVWFPLVQSVCGSLDAYVAPTLCLRSQSSNRDTSASPYESLNLSPFDDRSVCEGGMYSDGFLLMSWTEAFFQICTLIAPPSSSASVNVGVSSTNMTTVRSNSQVVDLSSDVIDLSSQEGPATPLINPALLLTDQFQPRFNSDVSASQDEAIAKLAQWMQSWAAKTRTVSHSQKKNTATKSKRKKSYDDDYDDDSEDEDKDDEITNVALLEGPFGSSKTVSTYACARSAGLAVLEVNASQDRKASDVKSIVMEASQSRRVAGDGNHAFSNTSASTGNEVNYQNLILFDEVDINVEEDTGMQQAIAQIAKITKCPMVLTSENPVYFLDNLNPLIISTKRPSYRDCVVFLTDVITKLIDSVSPATAAVLKHQIESEFSPLKVLLFSLVDICDCDLRKCLNHLQLIFPSLQHNLNRYSSSNGISSIESIESINSSFLVQKAISHAGDDVSLFEQSFQSLCVSGNTVATEATTTTTATTTTATDKQSFVAFAPVVTQVSPHRGLVGGGQVIQITGRNFLQLDLKLRDTTGDTTTDSSVCPVQVLFDDIVCSDMVVLSDTKISVRLPVCEETKTSDVHMLTVTVSFATVILRSDSTGVGNSWVLLTENSFRKLDVKPIQKSSSSAHSFFLGKSTNLSADDNTTTNVKASARKRKGTPQKQASLKSRIEGANVGSDDDGDEIFDETIGEGAPVLDKMAVNDDSIKPIEKRRRCIITDDDDDDDEEKPTLRDSDRKLDEATPTVVVEEVCDDSYEDEIALVSVTVIDIDHHRDAQVITVKSDNIIESLPQPPSTSDQLQTALHAATSRSQDTKAKTANWRNDPNISGLEYCDVTSDSNDKNTSISNFSISFDASSDRQVDVACVQSLDDLWSMRDCWSVSDVFSTGCDNRLKYADFRHDIDCAQSTKVSSGHTSNASVKPASIADIVGATSSSTNTAAASSSATGNAITAGEETTTEEKTEFSIGFIPNRNDLNEPAVAFIAHQSAHFLVQFASTHIMDHLSQSGSTSSSSLYSHYVELLDNARCTEVSNCATDAYIRDLLTAPPDNTKNRPDLPAGSSQSSIKLSQSKSQSLSQSQPLSQKSNAGSSRKKSRYFVDDDDEDEEWMFEDNTAQNQSKNKSQESTISTSRSKRALFQEDDANADKVIGSNAIIQPTNVSNNGDNVIVALNSTTTATTSTSDPSHICGANHSTFLLRRKEFISYVHEYLNQSILALPFACPLPVSTYSVQPYPTSRCVRRDVSLDYIPLLGRMVQAELESDYLRNLGSYSTASVDRRSSSRMRGKAESTQRFKRMMSLTELDELVVEKLLIFGFIASHSRDNIKNLDHFASNLPLWMF